MKPTLSFILFLFIITAAHRSLAQEKEAIQQVVKTFFEGMKKGDSAMVHNTLHSSARIITAFVKDSNPTLKEGAIKDFLKTIGSPHQEVWDERIFDIEIKVEGLMASVWMKYAFYLGDKFSHCGIDSFQFFKGPNGWKIFQIADTRVVDKCSEYVQQTTK